LRRRERDTTAQLVLNHFAQEVVSDTQVAGDIALEICQLAVDIGTNKSLLSLNANG
jgi:hypothetical protein